LNLYFYVSGHGFGHISRTSVTLKKLLALPEIESIHLISSRVHFIDWEDPKLIKRNLTFDVGVYQKDSLSIDVTKTKIALQELERNKSTFIAEEAKYCKVNDIDLILTDAASLPIVFALEAGIPSIFIGNFTWDFIYENFGKYDSYFFDISNIIKAEYSFVTEALLLPFTCPMPHFLESKNVGLVGRKPKLSKEESRKLLGFSDDTKYILLSFGAYGLTDFQMNWNKLDKGIKLVASGVPGIDLNYVLSPQVDVDYPDLVRAADYVLTKPGYGILSEAYYAETPILYTDRGDFAEYPILVNSLEASFRSAYISHDEISNCDFLESFSIIDKQDKTEKRLNITLDGEENIIKSVLEYS
jgi:hypothetical protein